MDSGRDFHMVRFQNERKGGMEIKEPGEKFNEIIDRLQLLKLSVTERVYIVQV